METAPTKTLWLLRHATAEDDPPPGGEDRDRMLSSVGISQAEALGAAIVAGEVAEPTPQVVLVSPASRTRGTAMLVFSGLGTACSFSVDQRIYPAIPDDLLAMLAEVDDEVGCLGIVGHNPTIAWFGIEMADEDALEGEHPARSDHPPATLSVLELPIARWADAAYGQGRLVEYRVTPVG
jgi:phosphohistidine phosphatase